MVRFFVCSVTIAIAMNLWAAPIPQSKPKEPTLYFPTKIGTKSIYVSSDGEHSERVIASKQNANENVWVVTIESANKDGKVFQKTEWEVSDSSVVQTKSLRFKERFAFCYLKLPHKPGAKWALDSDSKEIQCVAIEPRRVKVPAGEFNVIG